MMYHCVNINRYLEFDKIAVYGIDNQISHAELFDAHYKDLISEDGEILLYVYFKDIVDIKYIEVISSDASNYALKLWNYNMDIDFESEYPTIIKILSTNNKHIITSDNDFLTTDYFTMIISDLSNISNVIFYGRLCKNATRATERAKIFWGAGCGNEYGNDVSAQHSVGDKVK